MRGIAFEVACKWLTDEAHWREWGRGLSFRDSFILQGHFYREAFVLVSLQRGLFTQNLSERSLVSPPLHDVHLLLCGVTRSKSLYAHANLQSERCGGSTLEV